ncbi:hypothetical protein BCR44DRAFT_1434437 [Catenaria anguillulae PL171]|uniref:Uncharacterized protein n=1 Tax=Catenaria anguillulae PL171 TaxID=765915 RepID=A0A1Y2H3U2_9FUNG|nr:hypothetical protein BCR44DRAFT_1454393 [Catenaria anguillulae PL171]ORZ33228.1 hypothetical protein BCR44DRAFT_1438571 [Catenaria anguillulae PL171]ORZ35538.1 hypothetical protein BCR44DRAFT_1434437 [Catenaria anguillulae PL171]
MNSPALESTHYPEQLLPATFSVRPLACSQTADTSQPHLVFPLSQPCPCWLWILRSHFEKPRGRSCQARRKASHRLETLLVPTRRSRACLMMVENLP